MKFGRNLTASSISEKCPLFSLSTDVVPRNEQRRIKQAAGPFFLFAYLFHFVCLEKVQGNRGEATRGSSHVHNEDQAFYSNLII